MMAGYILYLYKTVRKFWGMAMVVTQELEDIISNPVVKNSIISNSDIICLLDQSKFIEQISRNSKSFIPNGSKSKANIYHKSTSQ